MNNRKIGGHVSTSGGIINAIQNTLDIGGKCMQIFAGSPRMWRRSLYQDTVAQEFREAVEHHHLDPVYIHALYLTNLASDQDALLQKSRQAIITDMQNSALIRSAGVVLHIGSYQKRSFDHDKELVIKELREILHETPEDSFLLLENSAGQKGKIGSLPELQFLLEEVNSSRLKVCIDTAHAFLEGHDIRDDQGVEAFIQNLEKTVTIEKIELLHINDAKHPLGSHRDVHDNLGEGYLGLEGIKHLINHPQVAHLPLILEVPGFNGNGPDAKNIEILRSLAE